MNKYPPRGDDWCLMSGSSPKRQAAAKWRGCGSHLVTLLVVHSCNENSLGLLRGRLCSLGYLQAGAAGRGLTVSSQVTWFSPHFSALSDSFRGLLLCLGTRPQPQPAEQRPGSVVLLPALLASQGLSVPSCQMGRMCPGAAHGCGLCAPAQVKSVNLSEGEVLSIRGVDDDTLVVLANQTLLVEGQVIRSPTNTISVYFRTFQDDMIGTFQLHYQGTCMSPHPLPPP